MPRSTSRSSASASSSSRSASATSTASRSSATRRRRTTTVEDTADDFGDFSFDDDSSDASDDASAKTAKSAAKSAANSAAKSDRKPETKGESKPARKPSAKSSAKPSENPSKSSARRGSKSAGRSGRTGSDDAASDITFAELDLSDEQLETLDELGYTSPTPIQAQTLPIALEGRDCIGQAPTGTGKTCAFTLPILERLDPKARGVQAIILSPTRELAEQVASEGIRLAGGRVKFATIVGGRPMGPQRTALEKGAAIVVGTPGRVLDLINRGVLILGDVRFAVLDEADRMLDFGFRPDIEKILNRCPSDRQTLLFSATMPDEVMKLVNRYQKSPEVVDLSEKTTSEQVEQYVCNVDQDRKFPLLVKLLTNEKPRQVIVFTRTKRGADKLAEQFGRALSEVDVLHGDLPQTRRDKVMKRFRAGTTRMLIATDIVGRGIDVSYVSHIVNYDVPEDCDDYVHRVGRTGRISSKTAGKAYTFATRRDGNELTRIEQRINRLLEPYDFGIKAMRTREKEVKVYKGNVTDTEIAEDFGEIE